MFYATPTEQKLSEKPGLAFRHNINIEKNETQFGLPFANFVANWLYKIS